MNEYEVTVYVNDMQVLTKTVKADYPDQAEQQVLDSLRIECDTTDVGT